MQAQNIVAGLPKFKVAEMHKICEACQFGKQARKPFPRHVQESKKPLELIHSDVWTAKVASLEAVIILSLLLMTIVEKFGCI